MLMCWFVEKGTLAVVQLERSVFSEDVSLVWGFQIKLGWLATEGRDLFICISSAAGWVHATTSGVSKAGLISGRASCWCGEHITN